MPLRFRANRTPFTGLSVRKRERDRLSSVWPIGNTIGLRECLAVPNLNLRETLQRSTTTTIPSLNFEVP